ncbi:MAG: hypothetical protein O3C34_10520 [Proteobacteria bacterium]|nr:hypothetical protein [Pseudomonadota bacterium]
MPEIRAHIDDETAWFEVRDKGGGFHRLPVAAPDHRAGQGAFLGVCHETVMLRAHDKRTARSKTKEKYPPYRGQKPAVADAFSRIGSRDQAKQKVAHRIFSL